MVGVKPDDSNGATQKMVTDMKLQKALAPLAVIAVATCVLTVSSIASASSTSQDDDALPPNLIESSKAAQLWESAIAEEQRAIGEQFSLPKAIPGLIAEDVNEEGAKHLYEEGVVDSLVLQVSRCIKLQTWLADTELSNAERIALSDADFESFRERSAKGQLFEMSSLLEGIQYTAEEQGISPMEAEALIMCNGLEGGEA
jgi:hypothetical protein